MTTINLTPDNNLGILSNRDIAKLMNNDSDLKHLFKNCVLAVMHGGLTNNEGTPLGDIYPTFDINVLQRPRGIKLELINPPTHIFVEGVVIKGVADHIFSVLRDIIYSSNEEVVTSDDITNGVFNILRNANVFNNSTKIIVAMGGHSITHCEYEYSKLIGYKLGLRGLNISTGGGNGIMKGTLKGACVAHNKQRITDGVYLGITEPEIISSESPNTVANSLVVMKDIEKRLEAFIRTGHGILVFPGGVGTCEEILYILVVLLHPDNKDMPYPLIFTGPKEYKDYFEKIDEFIGATLGSEAQALYEIIIDDAEKVAHDMFEGLKDVHDYRTKMGDAYYFNWLLKINEDFQRPFIPTHENMRSLNLSKNQDIHSLAANLRRAFSGIVAGNVKESGVKAIEEFGSFEIEGDENIMKLLDELLQSFVHQKRMKLHGNVYTPCYKVVKR
jgi:predicted Rossmann-fold nucleotide-binding protein